MTKEPVKDLQEREPFFFIIYITRSTFLQRSKLEQERIVLFEPPITINKAGTL